MRLNRAKYKKRHQALLNHLDSKYKLTERVALAIRSQIRTFIRDAREHGLDYAKRQLNGIAFNTQVYNAVAKIYKTVGVFFANDTYQKIIDQVPQKGFGFNQEWIDEIVNYFKLYLLNQATIPISESTRKQIQQILIIGEQKGWGIDEIARQLLSSELTLMRARLIVRTESAKAAFKGRELAKEKSPYELTSEWIAANDHRTRHSHHLVDGVVKKPGSKFPVPVFKRIGKIDIQVGVDYMEGPGDPTAHKENVINCRCTTAERVVFDENDNPVMKRQNQLA